MATRIPNPSDKMIVELDRRTSYSGIKMVQTSPMKILGAYDLKHSSTVGALDSNASLVLKHYVGPCNDRYSDKVGKK